MQLILDIDKLKIEQVLRLRVQDEIRKYSDWLYFDCQQQVDDIMFSTPSGFEHNFILGGWLPDVKGNIEFLVLHLSLPIFGDDRCSTRNSMLPFTSGNHPPRMKLCSNPLGVVNIMSSTCC
jgi:hypothetical protein